MAAMSDEENEADADEGDEMETDDPSVSALANQAAALSLGERARTYVNDLGLNTNCYYAAVAGARGIPVTELVQITEIMQNAEGGTVMQTAELIRAARAGTGASTPYPGWAQAAPALANTARAIIGFTHATGAHAIRYNDGAFIDDQNPSDSNRYNPAWFAQNGSAFVIFPLN